MPEHKLSERLPVHGFVLAGGKSTRMGTDKALLAFHGRPMVEIAVEKLRTFCANASIVGNRDDLSVFAPVTHESRFEAGPAAGIEAGLTASKQDIALFIPVDVPLLPANLLQRWAESFMADHDAKGSFLISDRGPQPAFCLLRCQSLAQWSRLLDTEERRLKAFFTAVKAEPVPAKNFATNQTEPPAWFANINTPQEFAEAESWAAETAE